MVMISHDIEVISHMIHGYSLVDWFKIKVILVRQSTYVDFDIAAALLCFDQIAVHRECKRNVNHV